MPTGVPKKWIHCKRCPQMKFPDVSALRKHQWLYHPELYANVAVAARRVAPNIHKIRRENATKPGVVVTDLTVRQIIEAHPNGNGEMTVAQLLVILRKRTSFMTDVIDLIGGIQSHPQEAAHE